MTFHNLLFYLEAVSLQSWVKYGRQLRVNKISVNGQMTLFPCAAMVYLGKEWVRLLQKILCAYNPRYDICIWPRPKFAYGIFNLLDRNLGQLEADFFFFKVNITRFYDFLFDCSHFSERTRKNPEWKHHQIIMAYRISYRQILGIALYSFFLPLLLVFTIFTIKPLSKTEKEKIISFQAYLYLPYVQVLTAKK